MIRILGLLAELSARLPRWRNRCPGTLDKANRPSSTPVMAAWCSSCAPISRPSMPSGSSCSPARATTTTCRSTASSRASWRRPATASARRHRRLEASQPAGGILQRAVQARHRRHGAPATLDSANTQFFIMFTRRPPPERQVHRCRRGGDGHGHGRPSQEGAADPPNGTVSDPDRMAKVQVASDDRVRAAGAVWQRPGPRFAAALLAAIVSGGLRRWRSRRGFNIDQAGSAPETGWGGMGWVSLLGAAAADVARQSDRDLGGRQFQPRRRYDRTPANHLCVANRPPQWTFALPCGGHRGFARCTPLPFTEGTCRRHCRPADRNPVSRTARYLHPNQHCKEHP